MTEFTPIDSLIGGSILGLSALFFHLFNARTAGISGIFSQVWSSAGATNRIDSLLFIIGMALAPILVEPLDFRLPEEYSISWGWLILAALLVGIGTKIGNGCTSGHGICGIGRLSKRSIVATSVFMITAIATVYVSKIVG